jgi:LysR family hca operon transcriptional activator
MVGTMDIAFVRPDREARGLAFRHVADEVLYVLLPADHRLAKRRSIRPEDIASEPFISFTKSYAPALRLKIDDYLQAAGVRFQVAHEAETLPMVISLVLSTGGVCLLPEYTRKLLPPSVASRPLQGTAPTIGLAIGYNKMNTSPLVKLLVLEQGVA